MKNNLNHTRFFIFALLLGLLVSCTQENEILQQKPLPEGAKAIVLALAIEENNIAKSSGSRAGKTEEGDKFNALNENKLETLDVFFFNADGTLHSVPQNIRRDDLKLTVIIPYAEVSNYENKSFDIVVIANRNRSIPLEGVNSLSDLKTRIEKTPGLINPDSEKPQDKFLMDGMVSSQTVKWLNDEVMYNVPQTLKLHRAAAKIRLRIREVKVTSTENGQTVNYEMVGKPEIKMVNYTPITSLIKGMAYAIQPNDWEITEYRTMDWKRYPGYVNPTKPGSDKDMFLSSSYPFYAYENDWSGEDKGDNETYLTLMIKFKVGSGQPKPYYYRIPVNYRFPTGEMTNEQKNGLRKIERNHLYDIVSSINTLGSEDEGDPIHLEAYISIEPWNTSNSVDGDIKNAHFLVVKEHHPLMPNIAERSVAYYSDLSIAIKINKTEYEYYDQYARLIKYVDDGINLKVYIDGVLEKTYPTTHFDGTQITNDETNPLNKLLQINHKVPVNFVPFEIYFTVTHVMPDGETAVPLSQEVHVTQYPPKYVTGTKSPGYRPNTGDTGPYADFRFHDILGAMATDPTTGQRGAQRNDVFYKITTVVNQGNEVIGDPTDSNGQTKSDAISNNIVSPEFIIATQHGMSQYIPQYSGGNKKDETTKFGRGYGPYSSRFDDHSPYYDKDEYEYDNHDKTQDSYRSYTHAANRCENYFEGEYGMDGTYEERYKNERGRWSSRNIDKTFKYKGRWRIPTKAELKYIEGIQANEHSAVKSLLWGSYYWTAQTGVTYKFSNAYHGTPAEEAHNQSSAYIRCVFDTYKVSE